MQKHDSKLAELWGSSYYRERVQMVEKLKPSIPRFAYDGDSNIEEIKYKLARLQAIEDVLSLIKPQTEV